MNDHYYSPSPVSKSDKRAFTTDFLGARMTFMTDAGVFSKGEIDKGTQLLLQYLPKLSGPVLDLGCGWGAIGVTLLKTMPGTELTLADVNTRALELARENLRLNGVTAEVIESDGFSGLSGRRFSAVVTNPPIRAGKDVIYHMFAQSREHLLDGGALYLVIRKQQGADSALKYLKTLFPVAQVLKKSAGFDVIAARV